jgi:hypothetical protein
MWILLDSWWQNQAGDLLAKLRQNLPLTIATTIVMSLLVTFWKTVFNFIKQRLGFAEATKEPLQPYLPEGEIAHIFAADKFRHGFTIAWGWRGAVVDAGVVQQELEPRRYRRHAVGKMIARMGLSENARVIAWRDKEFPVNLFLGDLFARDHQPMKLEIHAIFNIDPARLMQASLEELTLPPGKISEHISAKISLSAQQWVSSMNAEEFYHRNDQLPQWSAMAKEWIRGVLTQSAFAVVRVIHLRISSPALDQVYKDYGELALENEAAKREIERNKVRGALRQAVLSGKLAEFRDQKEHEDAIRAIEQERALKEKALNQELLQAELGDLEDKLKVWRRKNELLMQMVDSRPSGATGTMDVTQRMTDNFRRDAVESADSPFSAQEKEHIRVLLQSYRGQAVKPEELLAAVAKGGDIPCSVFDPLAKIRGSHTLRIGDGWKIFDGSSLWQIRLTRIVTRRHGFLWLRESPAQAHFEMRASPEQRRFEQDITLGKPFRLIAGPNEIPVEYIEGTPSRISVRIPESATGTSTSRDTIAAHNEVSAAAAR